MSQNNLINSNLNLFDCLHSRSVSWVRRRDGHILVVDTETFTKDPRISSVINREANIWELRDMLQ